MNAPVHRWVDLAGPVHYVEYTHDVDPAPSAAPPIVLVHGLGGSHANWAALGPLLGPATGRRVFAVDLPAHGYTPATGRDTRLAGLRALLHRFVVDVAGGPAVLVGHSLGGTLVALQAAADADVVDRLVLIDPALPPGIPPRTHPYVLAAFAAYALPGAGELLVKERNRRLTPEQLVDLSLRWICRNPERVPAHAVAEAVKLLHRKASGDLPGDAPAAAREAVARRLNGRGRDEEAGFLLTARSLIRLLLSPRAYPSVLADVDVPTLMLHGERDRYVPVRAAARLARRHGWPLHIGADVGHAPILEAPAWVTTTLRQWLAASRPAGHPAS